jgi:hypothetical protein
MDKQYFSKIEKLYKSNGFDELVKSLTKYIEQNNLSQIDAEELGECFFKITAGGGDYFDNGVGILFKKLHEKFPNSKKIKNYFSDVCDELNNNGIVLLEKDILHKKPHDQIIQRTQTYKNKLILDKLNEMVKLSFDLMSETGKEWKKIEINTCIIIKMITSLIFYFDKNNEKIEVDGYKYDFHSINSILNKIKDEMYKQLPNEGAWIMCNITINKDKSYSISFDYDNIENFQGTAQNPAYLIHEFNSYYPRSKEFTPEWWQKILGKKGKYIK